MKIITAQPWLYLCHIILLLSNTHAEYQFAAEKKRYNQDIKEWLQQSAKQLTNKLQQLKKTSPQSVNSKKYKSLQKQLAIIVYRQSLGAALQEKSRADLPKNLTWQDGSGQPVIGDPRAKKGGVFHRYILSFPKTLRPFGSESNHSLRGDIYDNIEIPLLSSHPVTENTIPGLAQRWAVSDDKKTVYFELNPKATYSDGVAVKSQDILLNICLRTTPFLTTHFAKQYYREQIARVVTYGTQYLAVTIPTEHYNLLSITSLRAAPAHFYRHFGRDYEQRYNWRVPPTTGAYMLYDKNIIKGRSFKLSRVTNWWAKDLPYYRYRYNADYIKYRVVQNQHKAFELFLIGKLDFFYLGSLKFWYEKMEREPVFKGYITKTRFYNLYPAIPRGIYLNTSKGILKNKLVRQGISHAMNFRPIIQEIFRGEGKRIEQFSAGYNNYTNPNIKVRAYNPTLARKLFAEAGYTKEDVTGILKNSQGQKLAFSCVVMSSGNKETTRMFAILKKEARKCGLELNIEELNPQVGFEKILKKEHDSCYLGWSVSPFYPSYYQFFHSSTSYDKQGNIKTHTNNINSYKNPSLDPLIELTRTAKNKQQFKNAAFQIQQAIHDDAIFIPAVHLNMVSCAYWRWIEWPNTASMQMTYPLTQDLIDTYVYWIDEKKKKATIAAKRRGKSFPEQELTIDYYVNPQAK